VLPETRYATLGELRLAYQVVGTGPPDLVMSAGSFRGIEEPWQLYRVEGTWREQDPDST
jgi:hypothetical protein